MIGGGNFDLKSKPEWKLAWYYFDGYILRFDDPGNIVYGVIYKETFLDIYTDGGCVYDDELESFGYIGAGAAQLLDNVVKPGIGILEDNVPTILVGNTHVQSIDKRKQSYEKNKEFIYNSFGVLKNIGTTFDDPRDYEAVELGYEYYDNKRYH